MFANNSSTKLLAPIVFQDQTGENGTCLLAVADAMMISFAVICTVILIVSVVGNSLLIFASFKSNRITMNLLIANTAASDLLFSIIHLPREIVAQIKKSAVFLVDGWIGQFLCKICAFFADVTIAVSTLSLVLITADRLFAVVFPRQYRRITVKKRRFFILCTWILAMAIHSPYFYTFDLETINGETFCLTNWEPAFDHESTHTRYYTALLVTVLIVPLVTVCILQTIILVKLKDDKMALFRATISNQRHREKNKMLLKMSIAIASAFAFCWLPFIAFHFLYLYFSSLIPHCSLSFAIFGQFAILLSLCHCIMNPCICFTFMHRIRIGLRCVS